MGLDKLKLIHINDSVSDLNSHVDQHEHIGMGKIGREGFAALVNHPKLKKINAILETPADGRQDDIKALRGIRNK